MCVCASVGELDTELDKSVTLLSLSSRDEDPIYISLPFCTNSIQKHVYSVTFSSCGLVLNLKESVIMYAILSLHAVNTSG